MSRQWKRYAELVVGAQGTGVLIKDLRFQFVIEKTVDAAPNVADIRIYNLSQANESKIKNEFDEVILSVGYVDNVKLIFRGTIKHVYHYREGNDRITQILAADGDKAFRTSKINLSMAAGTTNKQVLEKALETMSGVARGYEDLPVVTHRRGKVFTGNTRDALERVAKMSNANWSIQDGSLQVVRVDGNLPKQAIVVNSLTGMLGSPEVNDKGIAVNTLLNPDVSINGLLKLDNNNIKARRETPQQLTTPRPQGEPVRLNPDGIYKVIKLIHKGDTRGKDWFTNSECIGLGQQIPSTRSIIDVV